jgi:hypothetical protein
MRPPARPNRNFYHPLDAILGTEAAVRILRMLSLQDESTSPLLLAARCCLGRPGTWQALRRLQAVGIIEQADGRPGFPRYRLAAAHPLTPIVRELFERERAQGVRSGSRRSWAGRNSAGTCSRLTRIRVQVE